VTFLKAVQHFGRSSNQTARESLSCESNSTVSDPFAISSLEEFDLAEPERWARKAATGVKASNGVLFGSSHLIIRPVLSWKVFSFVVD